MSLHDRLSRIKQTHCIQLEQSDGCLDIRSSNDVVPYQHGSFISRTTRSASRYAVPLFASALLCVSPATLASSGAILAGFWFTIAGARGVRGFFPKGLAPILPLGTA